MGAVPNLGALSNRSKEPWDHARKDVANAKRIVVAGPRYRLEGDQNEK